jgi:hypothetical protein
MKRSAMSRGQPMKRGAPMRSSGFKPSTSKPGIRKHSTLKSSRPQSTAAEKRHMGKVAEMCCIVCSVCLGIDGTPAIVHHLRTDQGKMRAGNFDTLPLCPYHHMDSGEGVHDMGRQEFAEKYGMSEVELLHLVQTRLHVPLWVSPYLHQ